MLSTLLKSLLLAVILFPLFCCKGQNALIPKTDEQVFGEYWYRGKAEISSYELSQSRYGDIHNGKTLLVFVTEDFSKSKHVKLDDPHKHKSDAVKVMKLNTRKEFVTGMYDYDMMNSVYMPVDHLEYPHSFKLTSSTREWCGQSFMQVNWKGNRFEVRQFSYMEADGDSSYSLGRGWLEDELWTLIRIAPNTLPIGKVKMIASAFYIRLEHRENKVYDAVTSLKKSGDGYTYTIHYPELKRTLEIGFEAVFPYKISGWKEVYGNNEVTTGHILHTEMSDYWLYNHPKDEVLRDSLDLE